jgi:hypothetical protein
MFNYFCKNKEIKFKVWRQETGEWVRFSLGMIMANGFSFRELVVKENLKDWLRYTCERDSNGVEIYEGDMIKYQVPGNHPHVNGTHEVVFKDGMFGIIGKDGCIYKLTAGTTEVVL